MKKAGKYFFKLYFKFFYFLEKKLDNLHYLLYYILALSSNSRGVAQLVAHVLWEHGVGSSSLFTPTKFNRAFSSVGQSGRLITDWSAVRVREGPPSDFNLIFGPVVQLVRTLACHVRGRGFESLPGRQLT